MHARAIATILVFAAACASRDEDGAATDRRDDSRADGGTPTGESGTSPAPLPATDAAADVVVDVPIAPTGKPVFVAAGHMGRTIMSCDLGLTWINDRSDNDAARCWQSGDPNYVECDHTASSSPNGGLTFGDGHFFAAFGWGYAGTVRRSADGKNWDTINTGGWGGGVAYAKQTLFLVWESGWSTSKDRGATWTPLPAGSNDGYDHAFPRAAGDALFVVGRDAGTYKFGVSTDGAANWSNPTGVSASNASSIAMGNGVLVGTGGNNAARSVDGGQTWTSKQVLGTDASWASNLMFDGAQFVAFGEGKKWTSPDGDTWTSAPFTIDGNTPPSWWGATMAVDPNSKTFVGFITVWDNYYAKQRAYRSADGITWTSLDPTHFPGGHPLSKVMFAQLAAPACP